MVLGESCQKLHAHPRKPETVGFFSVSLRCTHEEKQTVTALLSRASAQNRATLPAPYPFRITPKAQQLCMAAIESYSLCIAANARIFHPSTATVLRSSSLR
jgi:hypothetical protein